MHEENSKNNVAALKRNSKMTNWDVQVNQIEKYFNSVAAQAKHNNWFDNLYVSRANSERQIQLQAGPHPIGSSETTHDLHGNVTGSRLHVEKGATLVISQSVTGDVAVILYPYKSEKFQLKDNNIIWRVFSDPKSITERVLKSAVKDYFTYARVSSALFSESVTDRMRVRYLSFRGKRYKEGRSISKLVFPHWRWLGIIGSLAVIYSVLLSVTATSAPDRAIPPPISTPTQVSIKKEECPKGYQPYANRCVTQRMADYISCIEASGGNKQGISDEISHIGENIIGGSLSASGGNTAAKGAGSLTLDKKNELALERKLEAKWFPGGMSECAKVNKPKSLSQPPTRQNGLHPLQ